MDKNILGVLIRAGWRQRWLILLPLVGLLTLSFIAAMLTPRQFQTEALIMIPDSTGFGQGNPTYQQDLAAKMKGLDALLKSDLILADVVSRDSSVFSGGSIADRIDDLRRRISTRPVSDNMVQITLSGGKPQGLGAQLNTVLAGLLEALLTPGRTANDAVTFVARQRQAEIETIERRIKEIEVREPALTETMVRDYVTAGNTAEERIAAKQRLLDTDRAKLQREVTAIVGTAAVTSGAANAPVEVLLGQMLAAQRTQLDALVQKNEAASDAATKLKSTIEKLEALATQQKDASNLADEIATERDRLDKVQATARNLASLMQQRKQLYDEVEQTRSRYRQLMERLRGTGGAATLNLLRAPAQVQIIDPPSDPIRPLTSRAKVFMIGIGVSLIVSLGLALLAEQIDPSLRSRTQLAAVTGLPVVAQFSTWPTDPSPDGDDRSHARTRPPLHPVPPDPTNVKQLRS